MIDLNLCSRRYMERSGAPCEVRDKISYIADYKVVMPPPNRGKSSGRNNILSEEIRHYCFNQMQRYYFLL